MSITPEQFIKTAELAQLDPEDAKILLHETNLILKQILAMHKVDVTGIEPMIHPLEIHPTQRDDTVTHASCKEALAKIAPIFEQDHYWVPLHLKDH